MSRAFYLHPACRPFCCGTCGADIDSAGRVVTRDGLEICEACDDAADEREAAVATESTDRGAWRCTFCGFQGFWSGGPHCLGSAA